MANQQTHAPNRLSVLRAGDAAMGLVIMPSKVSCRMAQHGAAWQAQQTTHGHRRWLHT